MEIIDIYSNEHKYSFYSQGKDSQDDNDPRENANTGDWDKERDDAGTDPDRYDSDQFEKGSNDNSGGAGSSGSAATNS